MLKYLQNTAVTVWHYNEESETYVRRVFENAHWYDIDGVSGEKGGKCDDAKATVRIFSDETVTAGDYVRRGTFFEDRPDKSQCLLIASIADNRDVPLLSHRKLVCV